MTHATVLTNMVYHGFMPIVVEAVDLDAYLVWLDSQV